MGPSLSLVTFLCFKIDELLQPWQLVWLRLWRYLCNYFAHYERPRIAFLIFQFLISVPYSPYFPHLFGYIEKAKTIPKSVLILSYEEMKENPVREVERIAQFLNLSLQPDELEEVAQLTSFQSMKANPATNYEHWDSLGLRDKKETVFMRKGNEGHSSQRHSKTATLQSELLFWVVFDHFWSEQHFRGSWVISKNWVKPKTNTTCKHTR